MAVADVSAIVDVLCAVLRHDARLRGRIDCYFPAGTEAISNLCVDTLQGGRMNSAPEIIEWSMGPAPTPAPSHREEDADGSEPDKTVQCYCKRIGVPVHCLRASGCVGAREISVVICIMQARCEDDRIKR